MRKVLLPLVPLLMVTLASAAEAKNLHKTVTPVTLEISSLYSTSHYGNVDRPIQNRQSSYRRTGRNTNHLVYSRSNDYIGSQSLSGRPAAWCGWFMRTMFGGGPEYNLAANWAHRGSSTSPHVGAVVVWPHHVGLITGQSSDGRWIVKSGNYGNRVAEVPMSTRGAIAFRDL